MKEKNGVFMYHLIARYCFWVWIQKLNQDEIGPLQGNIFVANISIYVVIAKECTYLAFIYQGYGLIFHWVFVIFYF